MVKIPVVRTAVLAALAISACGNPSSDRRQPGPVTNLAPVRPAAPALTLEVLFSSEKKAWAAEAIRTFNASGATSALGRPITVHATYAGSIEPIADIVAGRQRPHVFSPASSLVIPLLNDDWIGAHGATARPVAGASDQLVLSPVVVAMWRPMAEALGWPDHPIGWSDLAELSRSHDGWRSHGHSEWGQFRFGHTHPLYSNSGLIATLAENYAALGKVRDLTSADVEGDTAHSFVHAIESSIVHYGRSTGFFYDDLAQHGPRYLSAAVLYENLVVAGPSEPGAPRLPFPLVCVYPREGTMWADHPYVVLDAPWVGAPERDAAEKFKAFLLSRSVQEQAMHRYGFRPANTDVALGAPIDAAHGANPREPQTLLATPDARTMRAVLDAWNETKRGVSVVVVFDRSGSMSGEPLEAARAGLSQFLGRLRATDRAQLLTFSTEVEEPAAPQAPSRVVPLVQGIFAEGETRLFDAIDRAEQLALADARTDPSRIHAIVVLTDGADTKSNLELATLLPHLGTPESGSPVRIFTIGYGDGANAAELTQVATATGGSFHAGTTENIGTVYDEVASFF